jgi:hypothetical protein
LKLGVPVLLMGMLVEEGVMLLVTVTVEMSWDVPVQPDALKRV